MLNQVKKHKLFNLGISQCLDKWCHFAEVFAQFLSQLSVINAVDERTGTGGSNNNFVPIVSLEYGLVPTSSLTHRLRGNSRQTPNVMTRSSRAQKLARQLGKSRHFGGVKVGGKYVCSYDQARLIKLCFFLFCCVSLFSFVFVSS